MRRSVWSRLLAVMLVLSMCVMPVSAAPKPGNKNSKPGTSASSTKEDKKAAEKARKEAEKAAEKARKEAEKAAEKARKEAEKAAEKARKEAEKAAKKAERENKKNNKKPGATETTEATEAVEDAELTLVEGDSTVDNGQILRASTFALRSAGARAGSTTVYFPVTMYDYDQAQMCAATNAAEVKAGLKEKWEGIYFSGGRPSETSYTYAVPGSSYTDLTWAQVQAGTYYADEACTKQVSVSTITQGAEGYTAVTVTAGDVWDDAGETETFTWHETSYYYYNSYYQTYYPVYVQYVYGYYQIAYEMQGNKRTIGYYNASDEVALYQKTETVIGYTLTAGGETLATLDGTDTSAQVGVTLYTAAGSTTVTKEYAEWNFWDKASGNNANGDLMYTGLAQDTLVNDQIVFNVPEGGIFNDDTSVKTIYEYVGMPFVLNTTTGVYTFDSDVNGVYFEGAPQSGTGPADDEMHKLHFAENSPQPMPYNLTVGDGSTNAFFPFNNQSSYSTSEVNYHFGMRADIPFSMTPNGRIKSTDDESAPITFTFSGDDDVWVYIDGHLVIDLGGIHNRLDVTIDFAANTITYSEENNQDGDNETRSYNDANFATTQKLFNDENGTGLINMTREAFALDQDHEIQVFYLERGEGTSNARIEFNLPMNDTVIVTKDATMSWSQAAEEADLEKNPNMEDPGVDELTETEQAAVDNINFGFTLYKKTADDEGFSPVANTNFYLIGKNVEGVVINQTDANGHFYLKNGQSAKFITDIPMEGVTYYVVEDKVPDGFITPDFNFAGKSTYDYEYTGLNDGEEVSGTARAADASLIPEQIIHVDADENKSFEVTVKGSIEAQDSIEFICSNYLDAELPNPTALAYEDIIVIDYGLPVNIDPLANDVFRGDSLEILYVGGEDVTLTTGTDANGIVTATWTEDNTLNFGTVVLNDVNYAARSRDTLTYTLNKQLTEVEVLTYVIKVTGKEIQESTGIEREQHSYSLAKVYIVPATVMYYEENFSDMITFQDGNGHWDGFAITNAGAVSPYQEPGVVGTVGDSTYGSDVAYLNDAGDSNGTSRHGDTTNGAVRFFYTFTGTGTSVFARTSATTGYMQVKLFEGEKTTNAELGAKDYIDIWYRDTYYCDTNGTDVDGDTLYTIPVYTNEDLEYGTYTVLVTVAMAGTRGAGPSTEVAPGKFYNLSGKDFYLDGIRVMQPLNEENETVVNEETGETITDKALGAYATDGESNIDTITLRQKLITDAETGDNDWTFAVLTDTNGEILTAEEYTSIGPKEEVYLMPGQSVTFAIKYWHQDGYLLHMGMKVPFGTGAARVGQNTFDLANAADCYYNITGMHSGVTPKYEQAMDENGNLLYTDADGNEVYETEDGMFYVADDTEVAEDVELTPVDDLNAPYYVATYTITATNKIVSLTNLKVTGNYEFTFVEDTDITIEGDGNEDVEEEEE